MFFPFFQDTGKEAEQVAYAGENIIRFSGDTSKHAQAQLFAWEAQHAGVDVHLLAEPTKAEKLKVECVGKKEEIKSSIQESILERYGGKEHLEIPPKALLLTQTEQYVEYSRAGKIIKGAVKLVVSSRYEEDVYINNHQSVSLIKPITLLFNHISFLKCII
jgi:pre-mRNA-processing factor SLU7